MISYTAEDISFSLNQEAEITDWIKRTIKEENAILGEINYIFCSDDYLHKINLQYLNHDTLTDIISFDYSVGKNLYGDIFISIDRVRENANDFKVEFKDELSRVIIHGVLHYCGYKDKSDHEAKLMREKEDFYLSKR